jgi:predicted amidohydrolase YtcJ
MAVLDRDYFTVPAEEIKEIRVEQTMVGGNIVWELGS